MSLLAIAAVFIAIVLILGIWLTVKTIKDSLSIGASNAKHRGPTLDRNSNLISSHNPYAPPNSEIDAEIHPFPLPVEMVGSGVRFINFIIDSIVCYALVFILSLAVIVLFKDTGIRHLRAGCIANMYGVLLYLLYYTILEYKFGWTLGKLITKTRVVSESGEAISFQQALGRSFSRYVPFEPFSCFGKESRGWHDSWARTYVIQRRAA